MPSSPVSPPGEDPPVPLKRRVYIIIFEADTRAGKLFDLALLILIVASVVLICLETVLPQDAASLAVFNTLEWCITILFTIEYGLRIWCAPNSWRYIFSFYGIVDLLAILPTYVALFAGKGAFAVVRAIRLMRIFRILKLVWLLSEANEMSAAIWKARGKIVVFISVVLIAVTIAAAAMYELEGPQILADGTRVEGNYKSMPHAMYWAVVTMTTVGYGDVVPETGAGKFLAVMLILLGYSLIIVPTGFVSAEFLHQKSTREITTRLCPHCMTEGHARDAVYCKYCGQKIE